MSEIASPLSASDQRFRVPDAVAPPRGQPRFPLLDGLRATAALAVLAYHAMTISGAQDTVAGRVLGHMDVGVTVFFLLTGFLLYRPFVSAGRGDTKPVGTRRFFRRRALRILPAYWVALALMSLYPGLDLAGHGIPNALLIQIYRPEWVFTGLLPAWSLCVELSFYLSLPLIALGIRRAAGSGPRSAAHELGALAVLGVGSLGVRYAVQASGTSANWREVLPATFFWFALGMAIAVLSVQGLRPRLAALVERRHFALGCWLLAALLYAVQPQTRDGAIVEGGLGVFVSYGAIGLLLLMPAVFGSTTGPNRVLAHPVMHWMGLVSYGFYLYHHPILHKIHDALSLGSSAVSVATMIAMGLAISTGLGAASYYVIERPILRFKR